VREVRREGEREGGKEGWREIRREGGRKGDCSGGYIPFLLYEVNLQLFFNGFQFLVLQV